MGKKRTPGLYKRGKCWHIHKTIHGIQVCRSTQTGDLNEAEEVLRKISEEIKKGKIFGEQPRRTFDEAVQRYITIKVPTKSSLEDDILHLKHLKPYIGHIELSKVNLDILQTFVEDRQAQYIKNRTINFGLKAVRQVLNSATEWRDENGTPWLQVAPKISLLSETDSRKPYPLTWEEQNLLFSELPEHLRLMALFKVNTGCREQEVCGLKWEWEHTLPDLDTSIFVAPSKFVKNRERRIIVLNDEAKKAIEQARDKHPVYVFTYKNHRIQRMNGNAWRKARNRAGLPLVRVHDLKHTWGYRLRFANVPEEDRRDLLGHKSGKSMTTHYSAADFKRLIDLANRVQPTKQGSHLMRISRET
jgi:integrase